MNISYDYYRVFYHVAKYRNITQAAAVLQSNQPNVTRTIKKLENELGCVLFVRSHQGVQLTPEGEKLFSHVKIAFEHIEAGQEELASDKSLQCGTISIGASEIALHCLLLPILKEYRQLYPGIQIRVSNHVTQQAVTALKNGLVDIAVVTTPADIPESMSCTMIKSFQEVAVCGLAFELPAGRELSLLELSKYPLVCLGEHSKTYKFYSDLFLKHGIPFSLSVEAATADQILPLVMNDLGIGFVPETYLENGKNRDAVRVLKVKEEIPPRKICLIKRKGFPLSIAADRKSVV